MADRFNSIGIDDFDMMIHPEEMFEANEEYEEWLKMVIALSDEEYEEIEVIAKNLKGE